MGLLNRANDLLTNETLYNSKNDDTVNENKSFAFSDFLQKYNIFSFAICQLVDNYFLIKDSLGFDGKTISHFKISYAECDSLFNANNTFSTINIADYPFLNVLFSEDVKKKNKTFSFCKISSNFLMICNSEISADLLSDFLTTDNKQNIDFERINQNILQNNNCMTVQINFQEAIETFFCSSSDKQITKQQFSSSIFTEICNRFLYWYDNKDFCKQFDDYTLKLVFFTKETIPSELLINHIIYNLKDVLENSAEIIDIQINYTNNLLEIQDFFKAG